MDRHLKPIFWIRCRTFEGFKDHESSSQGSGDQSDKCGKKTKIHQLSESYFNSLTSRGSLAYMGITEEDVETMYQQYYIANKTVGQLTEEIDLEVSDSDAKGHRSAADPGF